MTISLTDFLAGSLAAMIMTLGLFYLLQAIIVYRSYHHESFAFAGSALCFSLYLLVQLAAFRMDAVHSLPFLRIKMVLLGILLSFWTACIHNFLDPQRSSLRFLPVLPLVPLITIPFNFYLRLPIRLELISFFGQILPYRTAMAGPGFYLHLAAILIAGFGLVYVDWKKKRILHRSSNFLFLLPYPAVLADILPGITRIRPLMITEIVIIVAFLLIVARFLGRDRERQRLSENRNFDLEEENQLNRAELESARKELSRYQNSSLTDIQAEEGLSVLIRLMESEKIYLDHFLTLPVLARKAGLSVHHLSQLINDKAGMNFNQYVNRYRVLEACRVLRDPDLKHLTMDQVCDRTGFNSLSVFNALFKQYQSVTPSVYRRKHTT